MTTSTQLANNDFVLLTAIFFTHQPNANALMAFVGKWPTGPEKDG